jgi:SAM-dependent MidA family methyltransferase
MNSSNSSLIDLIRETIQRQGPVSFAWFMEQALYHPESGFYSSGRCAIGRHGDYFTNISVGSLFGRLLAAQFVQMWELLDRPQEFTVVEQGAHHGDFARDVLRAAHEHAPEFFAALRYRIIESFPVLQSKQASALGSFHEKVKWNESLDQLPAFSGLHFSNELIDAMPVHLIAAGSGQWLEKYVTVTSNGFEFVLGPISTEKLRDHLGKIPAPPESSYETEINLAALDWIETLASKLERGFVLAVDYGFPRHEFYAPERTMGTLRCYAQHRIVASPFANVGQTDITSHVDWTSLAERAEDYSLRVAGFTDQHHFITALVANSMKDEFIETEALEQRRVLQTLLHPGLLGRTFQFLVLAKSIAPDVALSGFKFARDARLTLGLSLP